MVARFAGASLGLLAFAVSAIAGLLVRNPVGITLSRSILALFVFCVIGLLLGSAAQMVIAEHERSREFKIRKRYRKDSVDTSETDQKNEPDSGTKSEPIEGDGGSIAT
ncbi:MAG: hypothetical protein WBE26_14460 [Phycisphaerae bacterium]